VLSKLARESEAAQGGNVNLAAAIKEADARVQALINERYDRLMIRNRFIFQHARRFFGQRLRNDRRERK